MFQGVFHFVSSEKSDDEGKVNASCGSLVNKTHMCGGHNYLGTPSGGPESLFR